MKGITYEEWQKNPTPRVMWVWDDDYEEDKKKLKVLYISKEVYPVVSVTSDDKHVYRYEHCAEIEKRRMTNKELSRAFYALCRNQKANKELSRAFHALQKSKSKGE